MNTPRAAAAGLLPLLLAGCAAFVPPQAPELPVEATPLPKLQPAVRKGQAGGVFSPDAAISLYSDTRAFRPGDVLTIMLDETTQASKVADTKFGKESGIGFDPLQLFGKSHKTDIGVNAKRDFNGSATSRQQNKLEGAITVVVHEVLPGGLLRVAGEKSLYLNQGEEFVRVAGYVRAADIDTDNRVSSQRIANARIAYSGQGALADANSAGWLTRFFASPWMPF